MLEEILTLNIYLFILIFSRIGVFFFMTPGFGGVQVKVKTRLALALSVTFLLTPVLSEHIPPMPANVLNLGVLIIGEVLAGAILGAVILTLFSAVQVAGTVISFVSAMANALIFDPISQQQSAIVAGFLSATAVTLLFVTNMHHVFIEAMINSYALFPPGVAPNTGDMAQLITRHVNDTFKLGVQLASPFIVVSLTYYLGLGILTRLSPQVPIFFVAMPLQIVISIVVLATTIPALMLAFFGHVQAGLQPFLTP